MSEYDGVGLALVHAGKVRELYASGDDILMVATDKISAFDHVLDAKIADKGAILTQMSLWWCDQLRDIVPSHIISEQVPAEVSGRGVLVEKLEMIPVECVVRGYLTGSGWTQYQLDRSVCGVELPPGLRDGDRLPEPIFTPAIKAPVGEHDENVSYERIVEIHGPAIAAQLRDLSLALYSRAAQIASTRGIIVADTKFEFGRRGDGTIVLADEVLTPDSSRLWEAAQWRPGGPIPSFDKQYLRDWLASSSWDSSSDQPPPPLPDQVIAATRARYLEAYERLTGRPFRYAKPMTSTVVVNVMPKPEILDPQGKAVTAALARMGFSQLSVRQGKRFEVTCAGEVTDEVLAQIKDAAEKLLANTVIESFDVVVEG